MVYRELYRKELKLITYGKPEVNTFIYTKEVITKKYGRIKKMVMIGDNEETDIKGAYNVGW
jgi:ribonucleotide monophosphatase NagD (HAD superfamily)